MSKSEARKFINQLIAHPRIRQKASELRPHEDISGYVIDHDLSPCQVVLSVRADSPLSLQHKQAKRGFPEEIPSGPVWVDKFGLSSTRTRSLLGHADADKAVYAYSGTHYPRWRVQFSSLESLFHAGGFGENLTLAGMDEDSVCIGDIVRLGSSRLQVSQPVQLDQLSFLRSAEKAFAVAARHTKRTGWYYRVLEPGWITAGDRAVLIKRLNPSWSVTRFNNIIGGKDPTRKELAELTRLRGLASEWQWAAKKTLKGVEESFTFFWHR